MSAFNVLEFPVMLTAAMPDADQPRWLEKAERNTVAVLTLDGGECMTAEILEFSDDRSELIADVISSNRPYPNGGRQRHAIPVCRVVSFRPVSRAGQPWPYSDPCRDPSFSLARLVLFSTVFLCLTVGGGLLFIALEDELFGVQEASAIAYTMLVVFFTFSEARGSRPFMFTCAAVRTQVSELVWRHLGFLVVLFVLQTAALAIRPNLPHWWNTESLASRHRGTPFEFAFVVLCVSLAAVQEHTNRSLLDRAHREFKA